MLDQKITDDYKQAMKDKNAIKASTLSFLRAQIKNVAIEKKAEKLEDGDIITIIKKQVKQRQDSITQFQKGDRKDLVEKEEAELAVLKSYLPPEMSQEELQPLITDAIKETGAGSLKDMGTVMKVLMSKVAGRADGKLMSELVRKALSQA